MDAQTFFNLLMAGTGALGGWLVKIIFDSIKELRKRDDQLEERQYTMQENYVRRDDFREAMGDIKNTLIRIEAKIDKKADK